MGVCILRSGSTVKAYVEKEISKHRAAELLRCTARTVTTYKRRYLSLGREGLVDHRHSNRHCLTETQRQTIIKLKTDDRWRSARNIRDKLNLPVRRHTVWQLLPSYGVNPGECQAGQTRHSIWGERPQ